MEENEAKKEHKECCDRCSACPCDSRDRILIVKCKYDECYYDYNL